MLLRMEDHLEEVAASKLQASEAWLTRFLLVVLGGPTASGAKEDEKGM